jgi:hypothetical protein
VSANGDFCCTAVEVRSWPIPEMTAGGRGVRLLGCTCRGDPEAIKQAKADAIKAGYSNEAVGHIGRTPSDVYLFSRLPDADQLAILRQANDTEFARYVGHAHTKLRVPMRQERKGNAAVEKPAAPVATAPPPMPAVPAPAPASPPRSASPPPPPRGSSRADQLLQTSPLSARWWRRSAAITVTPIDSTGCPVDRRSARSGDHVQHLDQGPWVKADGIVGSFATPHKD